MAKIKFEDWIKDTPQNAFENVKSEQEFDSANKGSNKMDATLVKQIEDILGQMGIDTNATKNQAYYETFRNVWHVIGRSKSIAERNNNALSMEQKFKILPNGNVEIIDANGSIVDLAVNVMPDSKMVENCANAGTCASIMFIMSSKMRDKTVAEKVLTELTSADANKNLVAAFAILKRMQWAGDIKDGKKYMVEIKNLPLSHRSKLDSNELFKLFVLPSPTPSGEQVKTMLDEDWNKLEQTRGLSKIGELVERCIKLVNENPEIISATETSRSQKFLETSPEDIKNVRSRILGFEQRAAVPYTPNMGYGFLGLGSSFGMTGGAPITYGSRALTMELENLLIKLNAKQRELAPNTLSKFRKKLKELMEVEKTLNDFSDIFANFYKNGLDRTDNVKISEDDMIKTMEEYKKATNTANKKTLVIESALGNMEFKINGLDKIFTPGALVSAPTTGTGFSL